MEIDSDEIYPDILIDINSNQLFPTYTDENNSIQSMRKKINALRNKVSRPDFWKKTRKAKRDHPCFRRNLIIFDSLTGRGVKSRERLLKVGEEVLRAKPYAAVVVLDDRNHQPYCLTCHATEANFITCDECMIVFYCNNTCKDEDDTHHFECGSTFYHAIDNLDIKLVIQMVFKAMATFDTALELSTSATKYKLEIVDENKTIPRHDRSSGNATSKERRFECIMKLQPRTFDGNNAEDNRLRDSYREKVQKATYYASRLERVAAYFRNEEYFLEHLITHFMGVIPINAFQLSLYTVHRRQLIYGAFSYLNHSCLPNVYNMINGDGNEMIGVVVRPVKHGEELFINYLGEDGYGWTREKRREEIQTKWGFNCMCVRCMKDCDPTSRCSSKKFTLEESLNNVTNENFTETNVAEIFKYGKMLLNEFR